MKIMKLLVFGIIISILSISSLADQNLVERKARLNIYTTDNENEFVAQLYAKPVNMKDINGEFRPYEEVTKFYEDNDELVLEWNNKSVKLKIYTIDDNKKFLKSLSQEEKNNLKFKTKIKKERGSYYYTHNLSKSKQPEAVGYDVVTENVDCIKRGFDLICGEQRISFNDAVYLQNLTVNLSDDKVEFSGDDLSYIDPSVDLDIDDISETTGYVKRRHTDNYYYGYYTETGFKVGHDYSGSKYCRGYMNWSLDDINTSWEITDVKLTWNDYKEEGTEDTVKFYKMVQTDLSDWTPSDQQGREDLYDAIGDSTNYYTDSSPDEDEYNVAELGSSAASQMNSDKSNGYGFYIGVKGGEGNEETRVGIDIKDPSYPAYLNLTYVFADLTPPNTTANATSPPNGSGYAFGNATAEYVGITFSCTDNGGPGNASGCDTTYYCTDTNNTCTPDSVYSSQFTIYSHGTTYLRFHSEDIKGNDETVQNKIVIIDRSPNVSSMMVLPLNPTAGDDLFCNYSFSSPGSYNEKDSTYDWKKNGVSQGINSQVIRKENLTIGDNWSCEFTPSNGLANGTKGISPNVTILGTIKNPKIYVGSTLVWNSSGYYSDEEMITGFADEINSEIIDCIPDAEGYCNISITFSSEDSGKLNISEVSTYHRSRRETLNVTSIKLIHSDGTDHIFEIVVENDGDITLDNISWAFDTDDGTMIYSDQNMALQPGEDVFVYLRHNYSLAGDLDVTLNVTSGNISASRTEEVHIGDLMITNFSEIHQNGTLSVFEFYIQNTGSSNLTGINWSLDTGDAVINSNELIDLTANEAAMVYVEYNYTQYGTFTAEASSTDGFYYDSKSITVDALLVDTSDLSLLHNASTHNVFFFKITNKYQAALSDINWTFDTDDGVVISANQLFNLTPDEEIFVMLEHNFSSSGSYNVNATAIYDGFEDWSNYTFTIS